MSSMPLNYGHGRLVRHFASSRAVRKSSSLSTIRAELLARPHNLIYDYLSPTPSYLLRTTLSDLLTRSKSSAPASKAHLDAQSCSNSSLEVSASARGAAYNLPLLETENVLPQGHHIVYFPPAIHTSTLLNDGTDAMHAPHGECTRRLWAGGRILFNIRDGREGTKKTDGDAHATNRLVLDGRRAVCLEGIRNVSIRGGQRVDSEIVGDGTEKITVHIERRVASLATESIRNLDLNGLDGHKDATMTASHEGLLPDEGVDKLVWQPDPTSFGPLTDIIEQRDLIFMRARTVEEAAAEANATVRTIRPPKTSPAFAVPFTANPHHLFRFSALTFNAHAIHLNPAYTTVVEGFPKRLVHGPFLLVTILEVLTAQIYDLKGPGWLIREIEYRNLAPVFEGEEMQVCGARKASKTLASRTETGIHSSETEAREDLAEERWDVWILAGSGGLAVRATAVIVRIS